MRTSKGTYWLLGAILTISVGCSSHSGASSSATATDRSIGVPLTTAVITSTGTWATFPMGHLDDPTNTFWEVFTLPSGGQRWAEHTPPDVADNGGLVIAPTSAGAVIGFRPSNLLSFSPLASTTDGGATYTAGLLSGGLADVPDALSVSPSGRAAALTTTQVLSSAATLSAWQPVTTVSCDEGIAGRPSVRRPTTDSCRNDRRWPVRGCGVLGARRRRAVPAGWVAVRIDGRAIASC